MSEERFNRFTEQLRDRMVGNQAVPDDYRGDLKVTMNQGGVIRVVVMEAEVLPQKKAV